MRQLQQQREARGWTRFELGARACVHAPRVGQIENGRATPSPRSVELRRLAAALDYRDDPASLLCEVGEKHPCTSPQQGVRDDARP